MRDPDEDAPIGRLKRRADFLRAAKGKRWHGKALSLQANTNDAAAPRVGFTLTRKVGNAVIRNRARRRLREALRLSRDLPLKPGHDYVVVGRIDAIRLPFETVKTELFRAISAIHDGRGPKRRPDATGSQRTRLKP